MGRHSCRGGVRGGYLKRLETDSDSISALSFVNRRVRECMGGTTERYFLLPDRSLCHRQVVDIQAVHFRPHVGLQAGGNRGGSGGDRAGPPAPALRGALLESGQRRSVVVVGVIHGVVAGPGAGGYGLDGEEGDMKAAR